MNPASNIPAGHFNWGIAQGSIFVVYPAFDATGKVIGGSLGPDTIAQAPALPLTTSLGGTSVKVTVNGTAVDCFIVYTLKSQVAAVLPSTTPPGTGTLTVTYNGASGSTPIRVVTSNFGISTVDQSGSGAGVVTFPSYQLVDSTHSAKPGDVLVIWGTGLGAANSDTNIATNGDLKTNIQIWVGGVQATVQYRGRSSGPGLDQINFAVPDGVLPGCAVSLEIQTGGAASSLLSNTTTLAVMPNGGTCSDPALRGLSDSAVAAVLANSSTNIAAIDIRQGNYLQTPLFSAKTNTFFLNFTQKQFSAQFNTLLGSGDPSLGSCAVTIRAGQGNPGSGNDNQQPDATGLDAGAAITLAPPSGPVLTLPAIATFKGAYNVTPQAPMAGGSWKFSNGNGGADVPPFSLNVTVPAAAVWSNQSASIDRTQPYTIKWTGGDPNGYVRIEGLSTFGSNQGGIGNSLGNVDFVCSAPAGPGQFTIPTSVLLNLPAQPAQLQIGGFLQVDGRSTAPFTLPGFDLSFVSYKNQNQYSPIWR